MNHLAASDLPSTLRRQALSGTLPVTDLIAAAERMLAGGDRSAAIALYAFWIEHNRLDGLLYAVLFNYAVTLTGVGDDGSAEDVYRQALRLSPGFLAAAINLGAVLERLGRPHEALQTWLGAASYAGPCTADLVAWQVEAYKQSGRLLELLQMDERAEAALAHCLDLDPAQREAAQHLLALRQTQCRWPVLAPTKRLLPADLLRMVSPLSLAAYRDDALFQLANAHRYHVHHVACEPATCGQWPVPAAGEHRVLRVGYLSSDLRAHAIGYLTAEIYGLHDRSQVEVFLYYCGPASDDDLQRRIRDGADHWCDLRGVSDRGAASMIVCDGIDILVDVNGYTKDARTALLAMRPAPIIVNWLGFPGSMGTPYHHYIVADDIIIPKSSEHFYSEKVMRLACYQPNDRQRVIDPAPQTRSAAGLPEDGTVFCCFNGQNKITERMFSTWLEILRAVPGSVLWLLSTRDATSDTLKRYAVRDGISEDRIVFAERRLNASHLARYPLADLFLDTFPYGAHTTASDALWMGVPVLTLTGESFASRVCASLLHAVGLSELICTTVGQYRDTAIAIGGNVLRQRTLKAFLKDAALHCALFDTPRLVRDLEALYSKMWSDFILGRLHEPDLRNLDVYHAIGCGADEAWIAQADDSEKHAWYETQMAYCDGITPRGSDGRIKRHKFDKPLCLAA